MTQAEQADTIAARIAESLQGDREEGIEHGEDVANDAAIRICKRLAGTMLSLLAHPPAGFKWAVFGEQEGGASLVLRSSVTDRRVDFVIRPGKLVAVYAVSIDEYLNAKTVPVAVDHASVIRELAEWVANR